MKDPKKEKRDKIIAYLLVVLFMSAWIILALIVKYCVPEREYDEFYDGYLEEKYDGMERYDPF